MTFHIPHPLRRTLLAAAALLLLLPGADAHSGKARFHMVIDTDGAADDLRTLCMLLGNREAEVLAVTASEGALTPAQAAAQTAALLRAFHHEGIPVARAARSVPRLPSGATAPPASSGATAPPFPAVFRPRAGCSPKPSTMRTSGSSSSPWAP